MAPNYPFAGFLSSYGLRQMLSTRVRWNSFHWIGKTDWLRKAAGVLAFAVLSLMSESWLLGQQRLSVTLQNGMIISPVTGGPISSISNKNRVGQGVVNIAAMDDGLRATYVNNSMVIGELELGKPSSIVFPANVKLVAPPDSGRTIPFTSAIASRFDVLGRRFFAFDSGTVVEQGITEIAPHYIRVEGLRGAAGGVPWDMRISLDSVPPATLHDILLKNADVNRSQSYIDIVSLYRAAGRFVEARETLKLTLQLFPEEEGLRPLLKELEQQAVDQLLNLAKSLKSKAGQHQFAKQIVDSISTDTFALETSLQIKALQQSFEQEIEERDALLKTIKADIEQLTDPQAKQDCLGIVAEMEKHLTPDTQTRLTDYLRLREDADLEVRVALAIGGWIYGSGLAEENFKLVLSAIKAKQLVYQYLSSPTANDSILDELAKLESGSPRYVSRIVANIAPPMPPPDEMLHPISFWPDPDNLEVVEKKKVPGRYMIQVPLPREMAGLQATYMVQLPPEYNPYRRYPCIVTMNGQTSEPGDQLDIWSGPIDPQTERGWGEASKNGFIVVAPYWKLPKQPTYNYTENEQFYVLASLLDAKRRFSIDNDRVYLSGHNVGGDGAWDIALGHPDLWAGCIVFGGIADKYVKQYLPNTRYVPQYFVTGELAAKGLEVHREVNAMVWDKLLGTRAYDVMVTIYNGRGVDFFQEELPRIFEWINLPNHVRKFNIEEFSVKTNRLGDRFFWWYETDQLKEGKNINHPLLFVPGTEHTVESSIKREPNNFVNMKTNPADRFTLWFTPEMIDMTRNVRVSAGVKNKQFELNPDIRTLLQDVRTRCDRQHPFWAKVSFPD
ncbi:hypothetical protein SH449x_003012 [Pirellulaceae bacterium SH449]